MKVRAPRSGPSGGWDAAIWLHLKMTLFVVAVGSCASSKGQQDGCVSGADACGCADAGVCEDSDANQDEDRIALDGVIEAAADAVDGSEVDTQNRTDADDGPDAGPDASADGRDSSDDGPDSSADGPDTSPCHGSPFKCTTEDNASCPQAQGCSLMDDPPRCDGVPTPCKTFTDSTSCSGQLGCTWD